MRIMRKIILDHRNNKLELYNIADSFGHNAALSLDTFYKRNGVCQRQASDDF